MDKRTKLLLTTFSIGLVLFIIALIRWSPVKVKLDKPIWVPGTVGQMGERDIQGHYRTEAWIFLPDRGRFDVILGFLDLTASVLAFFLGPALVYFRNKGESSREKRFEHDAWMGSSEVGPPLILLNFVGAFVMALYLIGATISVL